MNVNSTIYKNLLHLQNASFSLIDHEDALVATVFKITEGNGNQSILKISERPKDYLREVFFLKQLADSLPVPRIVQLIEPSSKVHGAIMMEYLSGTLLKKEELTQSLIYEIGRCLALIHQHRFSGFGDPLDKLTDDPCSYFSFKFEEGLEECRSHSAIPLKKCLDYFKCNLHLLDNVDGPCFVHRDFRPGNILVHKGKLQGIIDWAGARASFAEEDFCSLECGEWLVKPLIKKSFLEGYTSIRPLPNYKRLMPLLCLNKAIAILGFTIKKEIWDSNGAGIYKNNLKFIENLFS